MQAESNESHIEITCYWATLELVRSDILALLRLKWTHKGRPTHVEEITPEGYQIVSLALQRCHAQGIGLMILSSKDPTAFCPGIEPCGC
jgi:uncharacterized protein YigA (DUF484 family)